jgi:uncharacterized membrane protein YoaK (UPF0700 family)
MCAMKTLTEPMLMLAVCLAALAGFIDVVAFLSLGGFFASFMSGNTTRLAIGIAGDLSDASLAASLILAFVGGVIGATVLGRGAGVMRPVRTLSLVAALILICAAIAKPYQAQQMLLLAAAMGAMNAQFERDGVVSVGLTYMTGTLVKLGQGLAHWIMRDGGRDDWARPATLWFGFVAGGLIGAGSYARIGLASLYIGGGAAVCGALWLWWQQRSVRVSQAPAQQ